MHFRASRSLSLVFVLVLGAAGSAHAAAVYGVDSTDDKILTIDTATSSGTAIHAGSQLGASIFRNVRSLAYDPNSDTLYGVNYNESTSGYDSGNRLVVIDQTDGTGTQVGTGNFGSTFRYIQSLAYNPNADILYGVNDTGSGQLVTIDTTTGVATGVGNAGDLGFNSVQALAYDPYDDVLYGVDYSADQLLTIDITTGVATGVGSHGQLATDGFSLVQSLAFDPDSRILYGVDTLDEQLLSIDTTTGVATGIGPSSALDPDGFGFNDVQGLAPTAGPSANDGPSAPTAAPTPSAAAGIVVLLGGLALRRRRQNPA